ncbi:DUF6223 family protein [Nocardia brasiliensis]|uniref:DUF6223 family protein n=1 Tax=Nocardia brasiliensis TaxID=37326 RepID=UPI0024555442|nr:DUF6223 family protein [Nocardia brasiliensis]
MSIRHLPTVATAVLLGGIALAAPAAASVQQTAAVTGMTAGRVGPTLTALVGLAAVVTGSLSLARRGRISPFSGRGGAMVALFAGLISVVLGSLFAATADGGPGTGNGIVAAWAAMVLGPIGLVLGGFALHRSRRVGRVD